MKKTCGTEVKFIYKGVELCVIFSYDDAHPIFSTHQGEIQYIHLFLTYIWIGYARIHTSWSTHTKKIHKRVRV